MPQNVTMPKKARKGHVVDADLERAVAERARLKEAYSAAGEMDMKTGADQRHLKPGLQKKIDAIEAEITELKAEAKTATRDPFDEAAAALLKSVKKK